LSWSHLEDFVPRITIWCNCITSWRFMIHWSGVWRNWHEHLQYYLLYTGFCSGTHVHEFHGVKSQDSSHLYASTWVCQISKPIDMPKPFHLYSFSFFDLFILRDKPMRQWKDSVTLTKCSLPCTLFILKLRK